MKRQQVISRFFAPKASAPSSPISTRIAPTSSAPISSSGNGPSQSSSTVMWPPRGGSSASGILKQDFSFSPAKKRAREGDELTPEEVIAEEQTPLPVTGYDGSLKAAPLRKKRATMKELLPVKVSHVSKGEAEKEDTVAHKETQVLSDLEDPKLLELQYGRSELGDESERILESADSSEVNRSPCENMEDDPGPSSFPVKHQGKSLKVHDKMTFPVINPARHKKFVDKLLLHSDERGSIGEAWHGNPPSGKITYTPLELQVVELKERYPDVLLLIEVGYKYRFFGKDAEAAARVLGIFAFYKHNFLTAGIPTFRLHVHVRRLVEAGYKVGVVRQTETAAIKAHGANKQGPFSRGLSALYTRSTLEAAEDLGGETEGCVGRLNSYLMCITEQPILQGFGSSRPKKVGNLNSGAGGYGDEGKASYYDTRIGVVAVETSTGDVMFGDFKDTVMRNELEARLLTCSPTELLLATPLSSATEKLIMEFAGPALDVRVERVSRDCFKDGGAIAEVVAFYESKDNPDSLSAHLTAAFPKEERVDAGLEAIMAMPDIVVQALALALQYLRQFGLEKVLRLGTSFRSFSGHSEMSLSPNALRQLEILKNNSDGTEKGTLLWLMDHTHTPFGARLLRHWVTHPLQDHGQIAARLDAVTEIAESMGSVGVVRDGKYLGSGKGGGHIGALSRGRADAGGKSGRQGLLASLLMSLGKLPDVQRGITRVFLRTATAAEFVSVIQGLITAANQLRRLHLHKEEDMETEEDSHSPKGVKSILLRRLLASASSAAMSEHAAHLLSALNTDAAASGNKLNLFHCRNGRFPEVAQCRLAIKAIEKNLEDRLPSLRKVLRSPKLVYLSVAGTTHLVEVPVAQKVPADWIKVNSTKKSNRFHPPDVLEALDSLALAKEELSAACGRAWDTFLADFASHYTDFRAAVQALAALDSLHSLAIVSRSQGYTRPEFVDKSEPSQLIIKSGRHPVLESTLPDGFVPNDTLLHIDMERCQIITGPNMGGKSCYIRQVALIAIMAQVGSYVPATSAKLHVVDGVFTRMGASDSIQKGSSTFFEELSEASAILRRASSRSLVIIDELGRGTSTHDGVAIAYATLQHLLKQTRCLTLFVTHYPRIAELQNKFPGEIGPYFVSYMADDPSAKISKLKPSALDPRVEEATQRITFLYKLVPGVASRSFGLHVARLAQLPEACVLQAASMATKLENEVRARTQTKILRLQCESLSQHSGCHEDEENVYENTQKTEGNRLNLSKRARGEGVDSLLERELKDCFSATEVDELATILSLIRKADDNGSENDAHLALKETQARAKALLQHFIPSWKSFQVVEVSRDQEQFVS